MPITTDKEGYLVNLHDWSEPAALAIATAENLMLTEDHWQVIHFLREFYQQYQTMPTARILVKELAVKMGSAKGNSIYLHKLFPGGLMKQAAKIAGLPKPTRCT